MSEHMSKGQNKYKKEEPRLALFSWADLRGIGKNSASIRVCNPPELVVVTLVCGAE
ncbi:MAG: hypothetical protein ACRCW2_13200 [Cellulosilyticaceae bacterium]